VFKEGEHVTDANGRRFTPDEFVQACEEWSEFIDAIDSWRAGRFSVSLTEWAQLPQIVKDYIEMHDRICREQKANK